MPQWRQVKAELSDEPDWIPLARRFAAYGGRRLRICMVDGEVYDTRLEMESRQGPEHDRDFWCSLRVIINGFIHYLNFAAVLKIRATDETFLSTDLILILDP